MHHARHTYVRGVRINRRTRKRRKRKELELQTKTPMTMTPSDPAQLHPRIMMITTESAPDDLFPLFSDIPDDDDPVINWFNIYQLTPARRIRGIRRKPSRNYYIFNPQPCERKGKSRRSRRQQTTETFQIPPPTSIPRYFILPTVLMAIFSTRLYTDTCHAFDEANLHDPLPALSFSTNADQTASPPTIGRRQRTTHKDIHGIDDLISAQNKSHLQQYKGPDARTETESKLFNSQSQRPQDDKETPLSPFWGQATKHMDINGTTDTTTANYKTIYQQYKGTDAPAQQYQSQFQQYKGTDAPAQTKSHFQQYKGTDAPAQTNAKTETNYFNGLTEEPHDYIEFSEPDISLHSTQENERADRNESLMTCNGPSLPFLDPTCNKTIISHSRGPYIAAPDQTESKTIINPEVKGPDAPIQQSKNYYPTRSKGT